MACAPRVVNSFTAPKRPRFRDSATSGTCIKRVMSPHKSLSTPRLAPTPRTPTHNKRSNNNQSHNIHHTSTMSSSHPVLDTKDRRSYEHARQKHLHPSDRNASR